MRRTSSAASASRCAQRLSRTEEGLEVLRRCFSGERFSFHGKRYDFDDVVIRPALRAARRPAALGRRHVGGRAPRGPRASTATSCRRDRATRCSIRGARRCAASGRDPGCATAWASSAPASSPTIPSATGRRCARPSAIAGSSTRASSRRRAARVLVPRRARAFRRRGWWGTSTHCVRGAVGVHRRARDHRSGHLGGAARASPAADEREPRALRARRGPAAARGHRARTGRVAPRLTRLTWWPGRPHRH